MRVLRSAPSSSDAGPEHEMIALSGGGGTISSGGPGGSSVAAGFRKRVGDAAGAATLGGVQQERVKAEKIAQQAALHAWNDNDAVNRWLEESYRNRSLGAHVQVRWRWAMSVATWNTHDEESN